MVSKAEFKKLLPEAITVEILDACNLKCRHCYLQFQPRRGRGLMDFALFEKIANRLSGLFATVNRINFSSVEALFHPRIFDMIDVIRKVKSSMEIYINTNGMLLDSAHIDGLLKRGIYDIHVSLDGWTKKTVEDFKTGLDFDKVVSNIKNMKQAGGAKVNIRANFVLHKNNAHELLDFIDFCNSLGIKSVNIIGFASYGPAMAEYSLFSDTGVDPVDHLLEKAKEKAEGLGINLRHHGSKSKPAGCGYAAGLMYVDRKGRVVPCSLLAKKTQLYFGGKTRVTDRIVWGDVLKEDPVEIWKSGPSVDFRYSLHKRELPGECALCAIGHSVIC